MSNSLSSLLLLAALAIWYTQTRAHTTPRMDRCPHCGDLVQHLPAWFTRCPSCTRFFVG